MIALSRIERTLLHKKGERMGVSKGEPSHADLSEGVPQLRATKEGLVEYVLYNRIMYKKVYSKVT